VVGDEWQSVSIHRLMWVAEHGIEAAKRARLEHRNGVRWDNRLDNIRNKNSTRASVWTADGYLWALCNTGGTTDQVPIHRLVYVAHHGFDALDSGEVVHHKNGVRWDNRPENLEAVDRKTHQEIHAERGDLE
jgi:hypothetical protein